MEVEEETKWKAERVVESTPAHRNSPAFNAVNNVPLLAAV
ncbi:MAG: hypothetical protein ACJASX_001470 [Limisphaerales bacterium]